jgi:hypothetical protein
MTKLLTRTGIRWWFRSRNSKRLNLLSYWLCVLTLSALVTLVAGAIYQNWTDRQAWLHQASEYSDWIYASPPGALKSYAGRFEKRRDELINRVQYGDELVIKRENPLVNAEDVKAAKKTRCQERGGMFGKSGTPAYPSCATYAKKGRLTENETVVFSNFAAYVTGLYADNTIGPNRIERELAQAFGFSDKVEEANRPQLATAGAPGPSESKPNSPALESKPNSPTFDVPWLYVASNSGAITVFPGTTVIVNGGWDTTSRPWFRGALRGESNLTSKGLFENDILSVTYLDVLAKSPMLVRTYMYKFKRGEDEFVIAVDLKLRSEEVSGVTPVFFDRKPDPSKFFLQTLWPSRLSPVHYIVFGLSVLLFLLTRRLSATRKSRFTFKRTLPRYGKIKIDDALKLQRDEQLTKEKKFGLEAQKFHVYGRSERAQKEAYGVVSTTTVERTRGGGDLRGFELWEVSLNTDTHWKLLWARFESVKSTYVGTIHLFYSNEILPEAKWTFFNSEPFSMQEEGELNDSLPAILRHNADLSLLGRDTEPSVDSFDVPAPLKEVSLFLTPPPLPDWLPVVADPKELLAARQGRAYVRLSGTQIEELYSKSSVQAVMTSGYFEQLLNNEEVDILLNGSSIARLISFPDHEATLNLTEVGLVKLKKLQTIYGYAPKNSRSLKRVNIPISNESTQLPVYDFAILNDSSVIVVHSISQATGIDNVSGKHTKSTYYVEGYVSWRPPDVEFYRAHFNELALGPLHELDANASKAEVV